MASTLVTIVFEAVAGLREGIALDTADDEDHESIVEPTDSPIETGAILSDHVHHRPKSVRINGKVVDFPLRSAPPAALGLQNTPARAGRTQEIHDRLLQLQGKSTLFEVHTRGRTYTDMILVSVGGKRAKGQMLSLSLGFREIQFADSQIVPIKPTKVQKVKPKQNGGPQTPSNATDAEKKKSFLISIGQTFGAFKDAPSAFKKAGIK